MCGSGRAFSEGYGHDGEWGVTIECGPLEEIPGSPPTNFLQRVGVACPLSPVGLLS